MYRLSDAQIDFILNDISARGVKLEDLQYNLLDHVCCIIERDLEEDGDFEAFYADTIKTFYKNELREIEEETILLLTLKNYYSMKKIMSISGAISVAAFIAGSVFKVMYWPGASALLTVAIITMGFVFLPLLCLIKSKEANTTADKITLVAGMLVGSLFCISVLAAVMHWPGTRYLWLSTVGTSIFFFIPSFFYAGIRRPETKINTILTSVILVGATGLQFTMINVRNNEKQTEIRNYSFAQNNELLKRMQHVITVNPEHSKQIADINHLCEEIKGLILAQQEQAAPLKEESAGAQFIDQGYGSVLMEELQQAVVKYNSSLPSGSLARVPTEHSILSAEPGKVGFYSNMVVLNSITQLQMYLLTPAN